MTRAQENDQDARMDPSIRDDLDSDHKSLTRMFNEQMSLEKEPRQSNDVWIIDHNYQTMDTDLVLETPCAKGSNFEWYKAKEIVKLPSTSCPYSQPKSIIPLQGYNQGCIKEHFLRDCLNRPNLSNHGHEMSKKLIGNHTLPNILENGKATKAQGKAGTQEQNNQGNEKTKHELKTRSKQGTRTRGRRRPMGKNHMLEEK